jgi:glycosyltransferase involved in cell wall biosynthesis
MNIAVVYQYIYPQSFGGGEKRLYEVFSRFPKECNVDWYLQYKENYSKYSELDRFNIINLENHEKTGAKRSYFETINFCFRLLWRVDFSKYDIIHVGQMPFFHISFLFLKKLFLVICLRKTPLITVDWWEVWRHYWKDKYILPVANFGRFIEKLILFMAGYLVVISKKTWKDVKNFTIAEVELIHNGVNLKIIDDAQATDQKYDVIIFGRVEEWKNPQMGVYVFEQMLKVSPKLKMIIVGDGSYSETLKKYVNDHGMKDNIKFYGFAKDDEVVYGLIKSSKLMMQFSKQEGGGSITLFEANACGVPVATAAFENGIDEALVTVNNGFFFHNHDSKFIAKSLNKYLEDTERQKEMRISAREFVTNMDWSIISNQYYEFFKKILKERA